MTPNPKNPIYEYFVSKGGRIRHTKPPFWRIIKWRFPGWDFDRPAGSITAFYRTIYVKSDMLPEHLLLHEITHLDRQGWSFPGAVWFTIKFFLSPRFRLKEEIIAYRKQYGWIIRHERDPEARTRWLNHIVKDLSGPLYGNLLTFDEARAALPSERNTQA